METLLTKAKTRKEVANEFGITTKTLYNKLREANLDIPPGYLYPCTLKKIYLALGIPTGNKKI